MTKVPPQKGPLFIATIVLSTLWPRRGLLFAIAERYRTPRWGGGDIKTSYFATNRMALRANYKGIVTVFCLANVLF